MKYFIENQTEVSSILKSLEQTGTSTGYQTEILINHETNETWEKYLFELEGEEEDAIGLRRLPYPTIDETIIIALNSNFLDEVDGASAYLWNVDSDGSIQEQIIEALEKRNDLTSERIETIYSRAELYNQSNKRPTLGKHFSEVKKDHEHFIELSKRAQKLLKKE
jgi:hypothetical protein